MASRCEEMREKALKSSKAQKLIEEMEAMGCKVPLNSFFVCKPCNNPGIAGGYVTDPGEKSHVVLCEDNVEKFRLGQDMITRTVVHELIHAFDHCRAQMDWKNCLHVACSEVRASHLSGDCSFINEFNRSQFGIAGQGEKCVRRRAELSVSGHEQCKNIAKDAIDAVFTPCFADRTPFVNKAPAKPSLGTSS